LTRAGLKPPHRFTRKPIQNTERILMSTELRRRLLGLDIPASEITPKAFFEGRRKMLLGALGGAGAAALGAIPGLALAEQAPGDPKAQRLAAATNSKFVVMEKLTPYTDVATYNNYYEFGTGKSDPAQNAGTLKTRPWSVSVEGEVKTPKTYAIEDLMKMAPMEERIYRLRCVEGWSMVIPWIGFPLSELIKQVQPTSSAKFVQFISLADPKQMPGVQGRVLDWPYSEGLRMDEAMNPLALLTFGLYGEVLPNQNGAPVRMALPWKYGFKGAKSIVKIRFLSAQPPTSWGRSAPNEYGFYSNVNPNVDHPRWSQATERRIGDGGIFTPKRPTLMFNGYGDQVASLYQGMDLKKFF